MRETSEVGTARRQFLKFAGLGAVTAGAVATGASRRAEAVVPEAAPDKKSGSYRETELVRRYYEMARL